MPAIISKYPRFGMYVGDVRKLINIPSLKKDFENLGTDKYVKEGYRKKHIVRYKHTADGFVKEQHRPLFQSGYVNPTHGDIHREYPEYVSEHTNTLLTVFTNMAKVPIDNIILLQAQRIICTKDLIGLPSVENWHRDGVEKVGIICVDRCNIEGGVNQFRSMQDPTDILSETLFPGFMVVFDDHKLYHRVTPIKPKDQTQIGYRDVLLMSYGGDM